VRATIARRPCCLPYGSPVGGVRIFDPDLARRLVVHEARAQQTPARELRDLGDGWLFHDPGDAEPFWNRLIAPVWPSDASRFDRRLDEVITLFATIDRLPHVRPLPVGGTPGDLAARLAVAGFETLGADRRMVLVDGSSAGERVAAAQRRVDAEFGRGSVVATRREAGTDATGTDRRWGARRRWAVDASLVLADAFGVDAERRVALENDLLACISRPGCSVLLLMVDGVPAAIGRRATTADGSYLSSIGTRPAFRRHGLGALVTALAVRDALDAGSEVVHLAVEVDNQAAVQLYETLGFAIVGEPAPDLLLR
jgi:ribosomal protein S18 acetylase RimI-like enzyme